MRKLFLDDERVPEDVTWIAMHEGPWDIVRNYNQFCGYIEAHGIPDVISFDNDLGDQQLEGRHCAEWLIERFLYLNYTLPTGFTYTVHSMNPIAAERIQDHLDAALEVYHENNG